jgi:hypothetical protein
VTNETPVGVQITAELVAEAQGDYIGLWEVVRRVKELLPALPAKARQDFTLELLTGILSSGKLVAGDLRAGKPEFLPWGGEVSTIMARIAEEWDALGHDPDIGDIVWLAAP